MIRMIQTSLVLSLALTLIAPALADGEKVNGDKLPKGIVETMKKHFPKGQFQEAEKWSEGGKTCYEVDFKVDGVPYEAKFHEDGTIVEYCRDIKVKELPKAVSDAISTKHPKSKIQEAKEHYEGSTAGYKLEVETEDGKEWCIKTDATGKLLETKSKEEVKKEKNNRK